MDMRAMGKSSAADSERKCLAKRALVGVLVLMEPVSHAWPGGIDSFEQQQFEQHVIARCGADWPDVEPFNPCPNDRLGGLEPPFGGDLIDSNPGDGKCEAIYTISEGDVTIFVHTCTLRAAIMEANALGGGPHTIVLQSGETYTLSLDADGGGHATDSGANNDDLDITSQITIEGNGATIQRSTGMGFGCDLDGNAEQNEFRIFHVQGGGNLTLQNVTVRNGCADGSGTDDSGGGIFNNGATVTITGSTLMGNSADDVGGGIYNFVGTVTITGSTLMGNSADVGGGIDNFRGTVTITNSTISGNSALSFGGGIGNALGGTVTITGSTLSGNTSADDGGAIDNSGTLNLTNTTISGNSSGTGSDDVGGIWNAGTVNASFVTIANNSAGTSGAGGIRVISGIFNIKNSIVGNNTAPTGANCSLAGGTFNATGANLATDGSCTGFTQVTSPQLNLQPLANNGGPTETHALGSGSSAIDAVTDCTDLSSSPVSTDQRGVSRPQGPLCDAGAFEAPPSGPPLLFTLRDDLGSGNCLELRTNNTYCFVTSAGTFTGQFSLQSGSGYIAFRNVGGNLMQGLILLTTQRGTAALRVSPPTRIFLIVDRNLADTPPGCP